MRTSTLTTLGFTLLLSTSAFSQPPTEPPSADYYYSFSGFYVGVNAGGSYTDSTYYRRYDGVNLIFALAEPTWRYNRYNVNPVIGFDFFRPCRIPVRVELSGLYFGKAKRFILNTLVLSNGLPPAANITSRDTLRAYALVGNFYIDWHTNSFVTPFLGVGIGASRVHTRHFDSFIDGTDASTTGFKDHHFAWNAIAGLSFDIGPNIAIVAQATYIALGKVNFNTVSEGQSINFYRNKYLNTYNADLGIRYTVC